MAKLNSLSNLKQNNKIPRRSNDHIDNKEERIKKRGLSRKTYDRSLIIMDKAPEELKERVRSGQTSINYAYKSVNRAEKKRMQNQSQQRNLMLF